MTTSEKAAEWLRSVADMVIEKGKSYGDSIGSPVRIFSKSDKEDALRVRIDDKLSRVAKGSEYLGEDTIRDLVGYLALLATANDVDDTGRGPTVMCVNGRPCYPVYHPDRPFWCPNVGCDCLTKDPDGDGR